MILVVHMYSDVFDFFVYDPGEEISKIHLRTGSAPNVEKELCAR